MKRIIRCRDSIMVKRKPRWDDSIKQFGTQPPYRLFCNTCGYGLFFHPNYVSLLFPVIASPISLMIS